MKDQDEIKKQFIEIIKDQGRGTIELSVVILNSINEGKKEMQVARQTIYNYMENDPEFKEELREAITLGTKRTMKEIRSFAIMSLIENLKKNNPIITMFTLKNVDKENFSEGADQGTKIDNRQMILQDPQAVETVMKSLLITLGRTTKPVHDEKILPKNLD
jgi:hypothetical protein